MTLVKSEASGPITASIAVAGATIPLKQGDQIAIRSTQLPTARVSIKNAPLVFLGYGVNAPERRWDDFKGLDVRSKILVVLINDPDFEADLGRRFDGKAMTYYGRWTYKFEEAARHGAAGVLIVHETAPASYGWATVKNSNTEAIMDVVRDRPADVHPSLEAWIQRDVAVDLFKRAGLNFDAEKKKAQSQAFTPVPLGNATLSVDYAVRQTKLTSSNVVGMLKGSAHPDETVIYSAHWDHLGIGEPDKKGDRIYNGARDNGTGIASVLELARVFARAPRTDRTVVFMLVTAEEQGLLGSEYYARHPLFPLETTVGVFNIDMLGVNGPARDIGVEGDGKVSMQDDLAAAAQKQGRRLLARPASGSRPLLSFGSLSVCQGRRAVDLAEVRRGSLHWRNRGRQARPKKSSPTAVSPAWRRMVARIGISAASRSTSACSTTSAVTWPTPAAGPTGRPTPNSRRRATRRSPRESRRAGHSARRA